LETEEQTLERERNECDVLDALGKYKCDTGMSVEDVPTVVNKKSLKGQLITHKFNAGWVVGVVKSGKEQC
jgi:GTP cyclohydrolase II